MTLKELLIEKQHDVFKINTGGGDLYLSGYSLSKMFKEYGGIAKKHTDEYKCRNEQTKYIEHSPLYYVGAYFINEYYSADVYVNDSDYGVYYSSGKSKISNTGISLVNNYEALILLRN
jgi:hypothetical protein